MADADVQCPDCGDGILVPYSRKCGIAGHGHEFEEDRCDSCGNVFSKSVERICQANYQWLYCKRCGWQADEPNVGMKNECPNCLKNLQYLKMSPEEYDSLKSRIEETSIKDLVSSLHDEGKL